MGFRMSRPWILRGLHLALGLSIPFVLTMLMSCIRAHEQKADLGQEYSADDVDLALSKAAEGRTLAGTHVGSFADYVVIRRLENSDTVITLGALNVNVQHQDSTGTQTKFTLQINKTTRLENGSFQTITSEEPLIVDSGTSVAGTATRSAAAGSAVLGFPVAPRFTGRAPTVAELKTYASHVRASSDQPTKITFHHLRTSSGVMQVPDAVKARSDCGGISACELPVNYIQFDIVAWYSETEYQKISVDFAFSIRTPYLPFGEQFEQLTGLMVTDCRATFIPYNGGNVYVRDCQMLDDFQK
jgi:hypothetical protein